MVAFLNINVHSKGFIWQIISHYTWFHLTNCMAVIHNYSVIHHVCTNLLPAHICSERLRTIIATEAAFHLPPIFYLYLQRIICGYMWRMGLLIVAFECLVS